MSEQEEKLQVARRLINEKRYDDARALLRTMPDSLTAQKWLQKLEGTASQPGRRTGSAGNRLMWVAILVMLVLTFAVAVYGAFLKPVPTAMARSDIEAFLGSGVRQWEYLTVQYSQMEDRIRSIEEPNEAIKYIEFVHTNDLAYDNALFGDLLCTDAQFLDGRCSEKFRGQAYYLNLWGNDGWELISVIDKSSSSTYSVEMILKRSR